ETAGALYDGQRTFWAVRLPGETVVTKRAAWLGGQDDVVAQYLTVANGHDGTMGFHALVSPVRVVCSNTLALAFSGAKARVSLRHVGNARDRVTLATQVLAIASASFAQAGEVWSAAAARKVTADEVAAFLAAVLPMPAKGEDGAAPSERAVANVEEARAIVGRDYTHGVGAAPGTAWGLLNAVSEYATHQIVTPNGTAEGTTAKRINSWLNGRTLDLNMAATAAVRELVLA
ncbi:MAG: DUF945 domain-containing protein, partial [Chloroflexota bacterium]|nr:DUF945 domain-containing protein [Chloroflexota bacterium]